MPENQQSKFFLTTPIYYVNARPHIGHAYTTIVADVLARRHRLLGDRTFFLTGTDEHGQKIERSAAAAGIAPQAFADGVSAEFRQLWDRMGLTYDRFIRTTDPEHKRGAQKLFADLYHRGAIYLSSYTGQYCVSEEIFVEGPPGTTGPDGRPTETVTEENFFFRLSAYQRPLIDRIELDVLKITPEARKNEVLSFLRGDVAAAQRAVHPLPLPSHELSSRPEAHSAAVERPASAPAHVAGELTPQTPQIAYSDLGHPYVPGALRDLSVSRSSFTWGIPVPDAIQQAAGAKDKHVMYVWLDALANYMTAIGYGSDAPEAQAEYAELWPADLHIMAKEITRQHCIYWPAFLLAAGLPLPRTVTAHGWLLFDNAKMSKSKGNIVRTETILDAFGTLCPPVPLPETAAELEPGTTPAAATSTADSSEANTGKGVALATPPSKPDEAASAAGVRPPTPAERDLFAADVLRYFLLREIPFGQDGSFSFEALITRYNADLANGYGNLVSRTLKMIQDFFGGIVPILDNSQDFAETPEEAERFAAESAFGRSNPPRHWGDDQGALHTAEEFDIYTCLRRSRHIRSSQELNTAFHVHLAELSGAVSTTDRFISGKAPWKLAKSLASEERRNLSEILACAAESIRIITALLYPFLPFATAKVWAQLGLGDIEAAARNGELNNLAWGGLKPGTKLGPLAPIFPRADKGLAQIMTDMEEARTNAAQTARPTHNTSDPAAPPRTSNALAEPTGTLSVGGSTAETPALPTTPGPHTEAPASGAFASVASQTPANAVPADAVPQIAIDDFLKVELRVAQVLVAERIPKADKLLRLEVDLGTEKRQILSGIAEWYTPEELLGRRIVVVANLAPRKMRGLESHGMLLAASTGEGGKPILATFGEDIALGSRVR